MRLSQLLDGISVTKIFQTVYGRMVVTHEVEVSGIQYDSRKVRRGDVFVAIVGTAVDGHMFINDAVTRGAVVVIVQNDAAMPDSFFMHAGVTKIVVDDTRKVLARISANFFGHPSRKLRLVGVTGTNGKTSTTYLIRSILESAGETVGLIGTIEYKIGSDVLPATHTTPESLELNGLLDAMAQRGVTSAIMEVSSHSLALHRVHALDFRAAAFTNLTQDHLDFHLSMEEYFKAKQLLFNGLGPTAFAITNAGDAYGQRIVEATQARIVTYATDVDATVTARDVRLSPSGTSFSAVHKGRPQQVRSGLIGRFNVQNILAAYATGVALGIDDTTIVRGIDALRSVPGRFEQIPSPQGWVAVIDYAHTPDALENCLLAIHDMMGEARSGRIITVFGCGGDRDRGKRPAMGRIATDLSDVTIISSDNPRSEDPDLIISQVASGALKGKEVHREPDRAVAIAKALSMARRGDMVLIAGKGHETYQVVGGRKLHFDDREEVEKYLRSDS